MITGSELCSALFRRLDGRSDRPREVIGASAVAAGVHGRGPNGPRGSPCCRPGGKRSNHGLRATVSLTNVIVRARDAGMEVNG